MKSSMHVSNETRGRTRLGHSRWVAFFSSAGMGGLALFTLATQASAASFSFSTGDPDGKLATLTRPASPGKIQTETADDFFLTQAVVISQATFTGLIPVGTAPASVANVEIEIYHVFPTASDTNRIPNVPLRAN